MQHLYCDACEKQIVTDEDWMCHFDHHVCIKCKDELDLVMKESAEADEAAWQEALKQFSMENV